MFFKIAVARKENVLLENCGVTMRTPAEAIEGVSGASAPPGVFQGVSGAQRAPRSFPPTVTEHPPALQRTKWQAPMYPESLTVEFVLQKCGQRLFVSCFIPLFPFRSVRDGDGRRYDR